MLTVSCAITVALLLWEGCAVVAYRPTELRCWRRKKVANGG